MEWPGYFGSWCFFANNFRLKRDTDVRLVSLCFSRRDASDDMQHDLFGWPRDLDQNLTWGQIFTLTFWGQKVYNLKRLGERNTMVPSPILFLSSKVICEKRSMPFDLQWPLVTWILTWVKKHPKWLQLESFGAFDCFFPLLSICLSFRVRRGGSL